MTSISRLRKKSVRAALTLAGVYLLAAAPVPAAPWTGLSSGGELASSSDLAREEVVEETVLAEEQILSGKKLQAEDSWLADFTHAKVGNKIVLLSAYVGDKTEVTIPATATIDGHEYPVSLNAGIFKGNDKITSVTIEEGVEGLVLKEMFSGCTNLKNVDLSGLNTSKVLSMQGMFSDCTSLTGLDVSGFDTSRVTDMSNMFSGCSGLTSLDVSEFDTSSVKDMSGMFDWCMSLTSLDLSRFDTSHVTTMEAMFNFCYDLTSLNLSGFDTSHVTNMNSMFGYCVSLPGLDVSGLDTSRVTDMGAMFFASGITALDVSGFDTSGVTSMDSMFSYCENLESLDLSGFDTSLVTDMDVMFSNCKSLTALNLSGFDMSGAMTAIDMFENTPALKELHAPKNVDIAVDLEKTFYDEEGNEYTRLPQNLSSSIRLLDTIAVKGVSLNCTSVNLNRGSALQLLATITPEKALNKAVSWSTSNASVAEVSAEGLITVKDFGTAVITVTTEDGGKTASCKVIVNAGTPVLGGISNKSTGVNLSWKAVTDVSKYRVYRKTAGGSYVKLKDVSGTSLTDSTAVSGTAYTYTVCAISPDGKSVISGRNETGKTITYLDTPVVNAPTSAKAGVRVSWPTVKGAAKYVILRHVGAGAPSWKWLKTEPAEAGTSQVYVDESSDIKSGTWYAYTIRALTADGTYSGQVGGRSIKYLAPVEVNKVQSVSAGVRVVFTNVNGGYTYRLYRSTKGSDGKFGEYVPVSEVTKKWMDSPQTVWIHDTAAKKGSTYRYYVRCISKDGAVPLSSYKNYVQITVK